VKIHLGVVDIPYQQFSMGPTRNGKVEHQTTGDVAEWLEDRYGVMEHFVDLHGDEIAKSIESSLAGALESLATGAPARLNPFGTAMSDIETLFKFTYLDKEEITKTGAQGVPTAAAKKGVNHRLKLNKGPKRPSFIDTGQYQATMKAWTD
jgi:hypothetical protein